MSEQDLMTGNWGISLFVFGQAMIGIVCFYLCHIWFRIFMSNRTHPSMLFLRFSPAGLYIISIMDRCPTPASETTLKTPIMIRFAFLLSPTLDFIDAYTMGIGPPEDGFIAIT